MRTEPRSNPAATPAHERELPIGIQTLTQRAAGCSLHLHWAGLDPFQKIGVIRTEKASDLGMSRARAHGPRIVVALDYTPADEALAIECP